MNAKDEVFVFPNPELQVAVERYLNWYKDEYEEASMSGRPMPRSRWARVLAACKPNLRLVVPGRRHHGLTNVGIEKDDVRRVDFLNDSITVLSAYSKNGETGTVPMHPELGTALRAVHDERKPEPDDFVFLSDGIRNRTRIGARVSRGH